MNQRLSFIESLPALKTFLLSGSKEMEECIQKAWNANPWFMPEFTRMAIRSIAEEFLDEGKYNHWISGYTPSTEKKKVAIVMAGNIPLVGFHDLLCVLASGHHALIKLSDKDPYLLSFITDHWISLCPSLSASIQYTQKLEQFDAVIATGSNNSARYFEYYFRSVPHMLRHHRNGVALLTGDESMQDLKRLAGDIFLYFGLGCRNVSKIFVPEGYSFEGWKEAIEEWAALGDHHKYKNNLDYNYAIYIINQVPHIHLGHLILKEDESLTSRIGCVHYSCYQDQEDLDKKLAPHREQIQCVISAKPVQGWEHISFGCSQQPGLYQYADGIDTMQFLTSI